MARDGEAWEEMEQYNKNDVQILEGVYYKLRPWIKGHANHSVFSGTLVCPTCGGSHYKRDGYYYSNAGKYQRFQCKDCGTPFRNNKTEANPEKFLGL